MQNTDSDGLIDIAKLDEWLEGQPGVPGEGAVTEFEKLQGGSQNNIYLITRPGGRFVLRRPPKHLRPNSNDTMLREARVLAALAGSEVPHPAFYAVCSDMDVIGVAFYLMEPIAGFTPMGDLPGSYATDSNWRRRIGLEMVEGAAALAAVDVQASGLGDFGKPDAWLERQVSRWRSQLEGYSKFEGYGEPDLPGVNRLGDWLESHRPAQCQIGIIHGDFQFANVMFAPDAPKLAAVVDWELSTLGDPLLDLAWMLTAWWEEGDPEGRGPQLEPWTDMGARSELIEHYGRVSGRDMSDMPWFFVLACYKLGILLEGTYARACAGKAPKEMGDALHAYARWLFAKGEQFIAG